MALEQRRFLLYAYFWRIFFPWAPCLGPPRLKKAKSIFFTNCNILHNLKKEPLNIMLLHTCRRMDGPWIKTVPVVSRIFGVSSSTWLGIEGCRTCWKDELGNHTLGMKAQNMHQLSVLGLNNMPSTSCHCPLLLATALYFLQCPTHAKVGTIEHNASPFWQDNGWLLNKDGSCCIDRKSVV